MKGHYAYTGMQDQAQMLCKSISIIYLFICSLFTDILSKST